MLKKNPVGHPYLECLQKMEEGFPQLTLDPWWIKFTDLLTRFPQKNVYKDIVFCFAQHLRLTDIVEFSIRADPVRLDRNSSWRERAMVEFYELFFPNIRDRLELMHFAQGHDETANKIESRLKKSFLNSMKRVEKKLGILGKRKTLTNIIYYFSNFLSAFLLFFTIAFYLFVYTIWLKRKTPQNIVIGGIAGSLPPVIGWTIATNSISLASISLFLIIFFWTPSHFWALSLYKVDDYKKAKIPMMPLTDGTEKTKLYILIYSVFQPPPHHAETELCS